MALRNDNARSYGMGGFVMFKELCVTLGIMLPQQDHRTASLKFISPGSTATINSNASFQETFCQGGC